jgi:dolichol kinase
MITAVVASSIFISWKYALPASILAILTETIILKLGDEYIDDNLIVPLVAGIVMFLASKLI